MHGFQGASIVVAHGSKIHLLTGTLRQPKIGRCWCCLILPALFLSQAAVALWHPVTNCFALGAINQVINVHLGCQFIAQVFLFFNTVTSIYNMHIVLPLHMLLLVEHAQ